MEIGTNPLEGMNRALTKLERAARSLSTGSSEPPERPDTVVLSSEVLTAIEARNEFAANLRAFEAHNEIARKTLDILG